MYVKRILNFGKYVDKEFVNTLSHKRSFVLKFVIPFCQFFFINHTKLATVSLRLHNDCSTCSIFSTSWLVWHLVTFSLKANPNYNLPFPCFSIKGKQGWECYDKHNDIYSNPGGQWKNPDLSGGESEDTWEPDRGRLENGYSL